MKPSQRMSIDGYLSNLIKESLRETKLKNNKKFLHEKDDLFADAGESMTADKPASDDTEEKLKKGDVTADDVVEKLNTIRSGKSFKDEDISASLQKYVNDMSKAERTALFAFLKGISQIVTAEISPEAAVEPSDKPANVKMKKSSTGTKFSVEIKPSVSIKAAEKKKAVSSKEDTSGPVPIKAKSK